MKSCIIIPARKQSSRLPNKPLKKILEKSMIEWVWQIANNTKNITDIFVATDCHVIAKHVEQFGGKCILTEEGCANGTERVLQAYKKAQLTHEVIINLQGDSPLITPQIIESLLDTLKQEDVEIASPMVKLQDKKLKKFLDSKNNKSSTGTTVVVDKNNYALYFSKTIIPHPRNIEKLTAIFKHIGLYAYKINTLEKLNSLPVSHLENIEQLEQLRALENNIPIKMVEVECEHELWSVDNAEDIQVVENIMNKHPILTK